MTSDDGSKCGAKPGLILKRFLQEPDGAVTVDWVVLTGFIIFLGMGTAFYVATAVPRVADRVGEHMESTEVSTDMYN